LDLQGGVHGGRKEGTNNKKNGTREGVVETYEKGSHAGSADNEENAMVFLEGSTWGGKGLTAGRKGKEL